MFFISLINKFESFPQEYTTMLLGRLEILAVLILFSPNTWKKI